ncbi:MAG: hypothetical protein ACREWI_18605 [Telluria sp.]
MPTRRILIAAVLLTVLGSAAPFASAAVDPANDANGTSSTDQVHRERDPFTDGANNSARDPYLDGAHLPAQG